MKQRKNPIHHPIKQLIFEMSIIWGLIIIEVGVGAFFNRLEAIALGTVCALIYIPDTFNWIRIFFAVKFTKPKTIVTRGIFRLDRSSFAKYKNIDSYYTLLWFKDSQLRKRRYYYIEPVYLRRGMLLEIVYYPKARFIKTITKLPIEKK